MPKLLFRWGLTAFFSVSVPVLLSVLKTCSAVRSVATMRDQLMKHNIIPDMITFPPSRDVLVEFGKGIMANFGNKLSTVHTKHKPWVQWSADPDLEYLLLLTDLDAPSRQAPSDREYLLWMVGNVPGFDVKSGETIVEYAGPDPQNGTGSHRYTFLVFKQGKSIEYDEPRIPADAIVGRKKFSTRLFVDKYKFGNPWAGNFFHAEWFDAKWDAINNHPGLHQEPSAFFLNNEIMNETLLNLIRGDAGIAMSLRQDIHFIGITKRTARKRKQAFIDYGLIPHFLPGLPKRDLIIEYKGGKIGNYGNTLSPLQTQEKPYLQWSADPEHYYAMVMTDLDAPEPKRHVQREWLHWMVVNIPSFNVKAGDMLAQYVGPHPKANTGFHRYVFTVFSQGEDTIRYNEPLRVRSDLKSRRCFSTFDFAEKYNLTTTPWAFNFIRVQYHGNYIDPYDDKVKIVTDDIDPWDEEYLEE